ncbi:MAG: dTDP-4-dehydrorhamnose 3,5-epimerase [Sandaracinaceae bacterium]|nr:dTDP-4-dehydrorhamnose 3,5-epimerase [Sandaracinaceae bacterium]
MEVEPTELPEVLYVRPRVFGDARGFFLETYQEARYREAGIDASFVQDNLSRSAPGILRGLHLQHPLAQDKLVYVLEGAVYDVALDVRVGSPTFGRHVGRVLTAEAKDQLFVPKGFAHGFCVISDGPATFAYKCSERYAPEHELSVRWDDPALGIAWPLTAPPTLSAKDAGALALAEIPRERLPRYAP